MVRESTFEVTLKAIREGTLDLISPVITSTLGGFNEKLEKAKNKGAPLLDPSFKEETAEEGESAPECNKTAQQF
jgi:hypothetical protein